MALVDMEREETDMGVGPDTIPDHDYPYGLCLNLDKPELDKLGITGLPEIGDEFHGQFVCQVTRRSESENDRSLGLQITMLEVVYEPPHEGEESETMKDEKREMKTLLG